MPMWPLNVNVPHLTPEEVEASLARLRKVMGYPDPKPASDVAAPPERVGVALPPCAFCGAERAPQVIETGLRCQAETWHVCHRTGCNETIPYHRERLEAGLVDCAETRAGTLRWVKERLGLKA